MNFITISLLGLALFAASVRGAEDGASVQDQNFVAKISQGGMFEVKLGEVASKKAFKQDIKDFGAQMVKDHGKANEDLAALAARKNWTVAKALDAEHQNAVDKLAQLSVERFDREYVSAMVQDHDNDVDEVKATIPKLSDPDLKAWAKSALSVMEMHQEHIKRISAAQR